MRQEEIEPGFILPSSRWPNFFSRVVAKLQWDAQSIDLEPDAAAWPGLPEERRERLTKLLAGFRIADDAVSEHLEPFGPAANDSLIAWVVFLQRRDEQRHATFFDRVAAEVLKLPGDTEDERRLAARELAPPGILELFEERLPAMAAEMAEGRIGLSDGMALYHMTLEGMVLSAGQYALLTELEDRALPGVREGVVPRRARRALAHRLRPALPDRCAAVPGARRRRPGRGRGCRCGVGRRAAHRGPRPDHPTGPPSHGDHRQGARRARGGVARATPDGR